MTRGVLMFAFDNEQVRYTEFAAWLAARISRYLGLPVSVVTNAKDIDHGLFDQVIPAEAGSNGVRTGTWYNLGRYQAYDLSPYDQTVLLDADYVVNSDQLLTLFDADQDLLSMRWAYDVTGRHDYQDLNFFGRHRMPSAWATVIYWRRSATAELIFGMMGMIQEHWQHYKDLYGITERRFRNDYALAIASNTVMGHLGHWPSIPWRMANIDTDCEIRQLGSSKFEIQYRDQSSRSRRCWIDQQDFHVMNKKQMGDLVGGSS